MSKSLGASLAIGLTALLFVVGCGGSTSGGGTSGSGVTAQSCDPQVGGTLTAGLANPIETLDPNQNPLFNPGYANAAALVYESLDTVGKDPNDLQMRLAESITANDDFTRWTIKLRSGVTFSDGDPFGAEDVIFTLEYLKKGVFPQFFEPIVKATASDKQTVEIEMSSPQSQFDRELASSYVAPMLKADLGGRSPEEYFANPVGTGPFTVGDFKPGRSLTLQRNPSYWDQGKPYLETIEIEGVPETNTRITGIQSGTYGLIDRIPADRSGQLGDEVSFQDADPSALADGLYLNPAPALFADSDVRHAISMAINRDEIAQSAYGGLATPATNFITPGIADSGPPDAPPTFDLEQAKQLMASSKHSSGGSFELLYATGDPGLELEAQIIKQQLSEIGIDVTLQALGTAEFFDRILSSDFDAVIYHYEESLSTVAEPILTYVFFGGFFGWPTKTVEGQLEALEKTADSAELTDISTEYENFIVEQSGQIQLVNPRWNVATRTEVQGLDLSPYGIWSLADASLCG